jgi:hypothetical protein
MKKNAKKNEHFHIRDYNNTINTNNTSTGELMENQSIQPPKMDVTRVKTLIKDLINAEYREYVSKRKELGIAGPYTKECNGVRAMTQNQFVHEAYQRLSAMVSVTCSGIFEELEQAHDEANFEANKGELKQALPAEERVEGLVSFDQLMSDFDDDYLEEDKK